MSIQEERVFHDPRAFLIIYSPTSYHMCINILQLVEAYTWQRMNEKEAVLLEHPRLFPIIYSHFQGLNSFLVPNGLANYLFSPLFWGN